MVDYLVALTLPLTVGLLSSPPITADISRPVDINCSELVLQQSSTGPIVQAIKGGSIKKRELSKGEFETSEEAGSRIRKRMKQFSKSVFYIAHVPLSERTKPLRYDADSETMSLDKFFTWAHHGFGIKNHALEAAEWETQSGSYTGENAYGAKRRVAVRNQYILELVLTQQDAVRIPTSFKVPRASAAQFKRTAHLVAVLQPRSPYMSADAIRLEPTTNAPSDFVSTKFRLEGELLCLAVKSQDGSADQILVDRSSHSS